MQQITRFIQQYIKTGKCIRKHQATRGFSRRYDDADIFLLAELDELHETPCGAVIKMLCARLLRRTINDTNDCNRFQRAIFTICEAPIAIAKLPFGVRDFHTDNDSECINKNVAKLLDKLSIEFTKSRSRQSNDNALVESKNASVIQKHFGCSHIQQHWAKELNNHLQEPLYRYLNFHRPCFFPATIINEKGKQIETFTRLLRSTLLR